MRYQQSRQTPHNLAIVPAALLPHRAVWQALGPRRFLSVSDTTAALGLPDGPTRLGDQDVVVDGGTVRIADGTLAGAAVSVVWNYAMSSVLTWSTPAPPPSTKAPVAGAPALSRR